MLFHTIDGDTPKKTLNPAPKHFRRISLFLHQMLLSQSHKAWLAHMFLSFFGGVKLLSTKKKHSINSLDFLLNYPPGTSRSHLRPQKETIKTAIFRCKIAVSFRDGNSPLAPRHPRLEQKTSPVLCSRRLILCAKPFHWAKLCRCVILCAHLKNGFVKLDLPQVSRGGKNTNIWNHQTKRKWLAIFGKVWSMDISFL